MPWRNRIYTIIFEADTHAGRRFDQLLIFSILLSLVVVTLDSIDPISLKYHRTLTAFEWLFTFLFTVEYVVRLYCVKYPLRYALSFYGIIDLLAILPTYLALMFPEFHLLIDVRVLRLLRVFRVFKLTSYLSEYNHLARALAASRRKILVFLSVVLMVVLIMGTLMYVIEGPEHGFTSIPMSIYWAITTITTVGFGDITPKTDLGRALSSFMMLMGWGILAVPTGIVTAEMAALRVQPLQKITTRSCISCLREGHSPEDRFCRYCGDKLPRYQFDEN